MSYDSDKIRFIDRIRSITFREARDAGASFISRKWIAMHIKRSERFVTFNWNRNVYDCESDFSDCGRPSSLSQESKEIIAESTGRAKKSLRGLANEIESKRGKKKSLTAIRRELISTGNKPFHVIGKPRVTEQQKEDRMWFCETFLSEWGADDFMHLAPSDEFFVYTVRKPNHKNDIIWARSIDEIDEDIRYRKLIKFPECVGIFVCFTAKRMMWILKEHGQSWNGTYFRKMLSENVVPFLKNPENVLSVRDVTFLHDKAPCFKALETQNLLRRSKIDFFANDEWPGASPDLNATEHLGAIIKKRVEERMLLHASDEQLKPEILRTELLIVLQELRNDEDLFQTLLLSYPNRIRAVVAANGGNTNY